LPGRKARYSRMRQLTLVRGTSAAEKDKIRIG
jgi:hypothetical protein